MHSFFYGRLALNNIRKNAKIYIPYIITCAITVSFYQIMKSLSLNKGLSEIYGAATVAVALELGSKVVAVFAVIFLFYINSFLMKRREKEFGLFHVLGMEKKHLIRVMAIETVDLALAGIGLGVLLGIFLDRLMYLLILRIIRTGVSMEFYVSGAAVFASVKLFAGIFFLLFAAAGVKIVKASPITLLRGSNVGEREPKSKWALALLGLLTLGGGYGISVMVQDPVKAIMLFFVAVLLVIAGTYLLFTAGSIVFLKLLRANKAYYYKTKHFISISGMLYRMKQNAVGLANICILSTMVLVTVSSTVALMIGVEDLIKNRYPYDLNIYADMENMEADDARLKEIVKNAVETNRLAIKQEVCLRQFGVNATEKKGRYYVSSNSNAMSASAVRLLIFVTLEDYNRVTGKDVVLADDEALVCANRGKFKQETLDVEGKVFRVKDNVEEFARNGWTMADLVSSLYVVVKSEDVIYALADHIDAVTKGQAYVSYQYLYGLVYEEESDAAAQLAAYALIHEGTKKLREEDGQSYRVESREQGKNGFYELYGAIFFLGIFLGLLFTIASILIIYYKQITEGYYDRDRYVIMQNVGMSQKEVRDSIHSQILTVFFLPPLLAGVHMLFAYPALRKVMLLMNMFNTRLYIICILATYLVFLLLYTVVYLQTARLYYQVVKK